MLLHKRFCHIFDAHNGQQHLFVINGHINKKCGRSSFVDGRSISLSYVADLPREFASYYYLTLE